MTPLIISTRRSDATLRAIRSVTMVGNVSTFLTSSIGDPTGTQPTVGLTPRTITDPASFMVGPAGLEPATSSTPRKRATTCATARRQQLYRERANRERGDEDCGTKRATEEVRVIPSPFIPLPPGRGGCGWRPSAPHLVGNAGTGNAGTRKRGLDRTLFATEEVCVTPSPWPSPSRERERRLTPPPPHDTGTRERGNGENAEGWCRTATLEDGLGEESASDWRRAVAAVSERRVAEGRALYTERSPAKLYRGARSSERYARQASRLGAERARPQPISRRSASAESSGITKLMCGSVRGCSRSVVSGRAARLLTASPHHPTRPDSPASTWPRRRGRSASAPCPRWFWPRSGTIRRCGPAQSAHPLPTSRAARARSGPPLPGRYNRYRGGTRAASARPRPAHREAAASHFRPHPAALPGLRRMAPRCVPHAGAQPGTLPR